MRKILLFASCIFTAIQLMAIPAKPVQKTLHLADGTDVVATLRGDENFHFYTSADGRYFVPQNNSYIAISKDEITTRSKALHQQKARALRNGAKKLPPINTNNCKGTKKGIVILVNFSDLKMVESDPLTVFNDFFNKEGFTDYGMTGSVHDYFYDQSYGQLNYTFDVIGPVQVLQPYAYYGADDESRKDVNCSDMVKEACKLVDDKVNFADYDADGDGNVDQVFIVYAGYSQAQGAPDESLWPKEASGSYGTFDGVNINTYAISNELNGTSGTNLCGIGAACHEFSHCLGIPDMYDTDYSGGFAMSYWDVMAQGNYLNNSCTPCGYTAFERMYAGWLVPQELSEQTTITDMPDIATNPTAYILCNEGNRNEYYILENRQKTKWNSYLYGHGLQVLHVDYDAEVWEGNDVNNNPNRQRCILIPADGVLANTASSLAGDLWPGTSKNTDLTSNTTPAATVYTANKDKSMFMRRNINKIQENSGLISFIACTPDLATPYVDSTKAVCTDSTLTFSWNSIEGATSYNVDVTETPLSKHDIKECLLYTEDFTTCYTKTNGFTDIGSKMSNYVSSGWSGSKLFTTPNYLRVGTSSAAGTLKSPYYEVPESGEVTVVYDVTQYKTGTTVKGTFKVQVSEDKVYVTSTTNYSFELTKSGLLLLHLTGIKGICSITLAPETPLYLKTFTIYEGNWTEEELLAASSSKAFAPRKITQKTYTTTETSYTIPVSKTSTYTVKVQALNSILTSTWSDEVVFDMSKAVSSYTLGDINADGSISVADLTLLIDMIMNGADSTSVAFKAADMNGDSKIDVADLTNLVSVIMNASSKAYIKPTE